MKPGLCLFTDSLEPSGLGEHMLTLAAELRRRYAILVVCPPSRAGVRLLERTAAMDLATLALEVNEDREAQRTLSRCLRARNIRVFHGHAGIGWEGHHGIYVAREAEIPAIVRTEHLPDLVTVPEHRLEYHRMVQAVDRLICVSEAARASYVRGGVPTEKLRLVRNGIALRPVAEDRRQVRGRLALEPRAWIVLTVARMTEQKGHRDLLDAMPAVLAREPLARFLWVGEGPLEPALRARADELGLEKYVWFLGGREDVPELLTAADLFVLPSRFEGLPLAMLEAMAAGLPVVGTRVCGTTEAVCDGVTGRLVDPGDPAALSAAILEVLEQPEQAARWGSAGRRHVERQFNAARMAEETVAVYQEVVQPSPPEPSLALSLRGERRRDP